MTTLAPVTARMKSSAEASDGTGSPWGTTMPMPVGQIVTRLAPSIFPSLTRAGIDRLDPMTRSAVSPAATRRGRLSAPARDRRVNHATVARRVGSLEAAVGHPLFDRRADGYALTADGKAVLDEARPMDEAALSVLRRLDAGTD